MYCTCPKECLIGSNEKRVQKSYGFPTCGCLSKKNYSAKLRGRVCAHVIYLLVTALQGKLDTLWVHHLFSLPVPFACFHLLPLWFNMLSPSLLVSFIKHSHLSHLRFVTGRKQSFYIMLSSFNFLLPCHMTLVFISNLE